MHRREADRRREAAGLSQFTAAYRDKVKKPGKVVRAKDLYDVCRISRFHRAATGRVLATGRRGVPRRRPVPRIDCQGMATFQEQWDVTRTTYEGATILKDISFEYAEATLIES